MRYRVKKKPDLTEGETRIIIIIIIMYSLKKGIKKKIGKELFFPLHKNPPQRGALLFY